MCDIGTVTEVSFPDTSSTAPAIHDCMRAHALIQVVIQSHISVIDVCNVNSKVPPRIIGFASCTQRLIQSVNQNRTSCPCRRNCINNDEPVVMCLLGQTVSIPDCRAGAFVQFLDPGCTIMVSHKKYYDRCTLIKGLLTVKLEG